MIGNLWRRRLTRPALAVACLALATLTGCVERRYTIRTNPPGALVYVNGEEQGPSPVSQSYTYYGPREIILVADGHQTQKIIQPMDAPWYDNVLTDFFTENLLPFTIRDEREFEYSLMPAAAPDMPDLVNRADALRGQAQSPPPVRRNGFSTWFGF